MLGEIIFEGDIVKVPSSNYENLKNTFAKFYIVFENNKNDDYVIIRVKNKNIKLKYIWHEVSCGKLRLCTSKGVFKILL